jgi:hypothetical protein
MGFPMAFPGVPKDTLGELEEKRKVKAELVWVGFVVEDQ